jgi:hypothetical protein
VALFELRVDVVMPESSDHPDGFCGRPVRMA